MKTLRERVEECERRWPEVSRTTVARAAGIKPPSVTDWFNGKTTRLRLKPAVGAAALWKCNALWLGEGTGTPDWQDTPAPTVVRQSLTAQPDLAELVVDAVASMTPTRWTSVQAQLADLAAHPDKRDAILTEVRALLALPVSDAKKAA